MENINPLPEETQYKDTISPDIWSDEGELQPITAETFLNHTNELKSVLFPLDVFPLPVQEIITATNKALNFPVDFTGASMLFASSVAVGNTHCIEVTNGHQQTAVLYLAIVAPPGTTKTFPLRFALTPINEHDAKTHKTYKDELKEYNKSIGLYKKEQTGKEPTKPILRKFLLTDYTPEALSGVHEFNKRGIGVDNDELAGWFKNFNRYNKGSEGEFWISVWSGKPINIDRKTSDPILITKPFVSVAGTIQTAILNELAKNNRSKNGFIDRILFVVLENLQKEPWSETELQDCHIENWKNIISNLLVLTTENDENFNPVPKVLRLIPEAKKLLFEWQKTNTNLCNNTENEALKGIYSKLDIHVCRLALILEMMHYACGLSDKSAISVKSVQGAIKLVEYFRVSATKVNSILSNFDPLEAYPIDKQELYKALPNRFTTSEGLQVAKAIRVPERTFKHYLSSNKNLFNQLKWGVYEKRL